MQSLSHFLFSSFRPQLINYLFLWTGNRRTLPHASLMKVIVIALCVTTIDQYPRHSFVLSYLSTLCTHIYSHLSDYNILCDKQHGFCQAKSFETQLSLTTNDYVLNLNNNNGKTDFILLDFSKVVGFALHTVYAVTCLTSCAPLGKILNLPLL